MEDISILDDFWSDDGEHFVTWQGTQWWCATHEQDYYRSCFMDQEEDSVRDLGWDEEE